MGFYFCALRLTLVLSLSRIGVFCLDWDWDFLSSSLDVGVGVGAALLRPTFSLVTASGAADVGGLRRVDRLGRSVDSDSGSGSDSRGGAFLFGIAVSVILDLLCREPSFTAWKRNGRGIM